MILKIINFKRETGHIPSLVLDYQLETTKDERLPEGFSFEKIIKVAFTLQPAENNSLVTKKDLDIWIRDEMRKSMNKEIRKIIDEPIREILKKFDDGGKADG